jgi:hypothetical protein
MAFFSKTNVMIKSLHNLAFFVLSQNSNFFAIFSAKFKKNHNIGPWRTLVGRFLCFFFNFTRSFRVDVLNRTAVAVLAPKGLPCSLARK